METNFFRMIVGSKGQGRVHGTELFGKVRATLGMQGVAGEMLAAPPCSTALEGNGALQLNN